MSSTLASFFESIFPTAHAEEEKPAEEEAQAEEEEDEPEDILPGLRDDCKATPACSGFDKHFQHCTEKVTSGNGFKGEDCVEELCKHIISSQFQGLTFDLFLALPSSPNCVAPKLFSKLR